VDTEKDYELRMDMLGLVEHLLQQPNLHSTIVFYTEIIVKLILLPSTEWRVGLPNVSIRKAAVLCLLKLLDQKLIEPAKLQPMFTEIVNKMKGCLDDEWANELRFASLVFTKNLLLYLQGVLTRDDYITIYPELLKRLDDA
jgi:dynein assembly factor 5, axonemal